MSIIYEEGDLFMFCTNCGNKLDDTAKFCTSCGTPTNLNKQVPEAAAPVEEVPVVAEPVVIQQEEYIPAQPINDNVNIEQPVQQEIPTQQPMNQEAPEQPVVQDMELQQQVSPEMVIQQPVNQPMEPQQPMNQPIPMQQSENQPMPTPIQQAPGSIYQIPNQPNTVGGQMGDMVPVPVKKSKTKLLVITGICIAVLAIGGGVGYFLYQNNIKKQAKNVLAYLEEGEYDKALDLYEKYTGKQKDFDSQVEEELLNRAEQIREDFLSEKLNYADAKKQLHILEDYDIDELEDTTKDIGKFIDKINLSRENYKEGKAYFEQGDYTSAITMFSSVIKEDSKYYDLALKEIEKAKQEEALQLEAERINSLREQILDDANYYASYNDYDTAINVLEGGLIEIPGDQALNDLLAAYKLQQEMTLVANSITSSEYNTTYQDQGKDVATVSLVFPYLEGDNPAYNNINQTFEQIMNDYKSYGESLADTAREFASDEYFYAYSLDVGYSVRYNQNGILCIMLEGYDYTGGAHGYPVRQVLTFDLRTGYQLWLSDLMDTDEATFGSYVTEEFDRMYNEGLTMYWEDSQQTVQNSLTYFDTMNYYLTDDGICIFWYPYDLASYADGFVEIFVPYAGKEWMFKFLN